jgi:hypothetical protein
MACIAFSSSSTPFALSPSITMSAVFLDVMLDDSLPGQFIGTFVATIGWVISSVIRAHHADKAARLGGSRRHRL